MEYERRTRGRIMDVPVSVAVVSMVASPIPFTKSNCSLASRARTVEHAGVQLL
jgi:hypothetical protein